MMQFFRRGAAGAGFVLVLALAALAPAHPGSGIAVDDAGIVYFTDTGKGIWKLEPGGKPALISPERPHWIAFDPAGGFAKSREKFARNWFQRLTPEGSRPTILASWEYPAVIGRDGALYYVNTLRPPGKIVRRTAEGKETPIAEIVEEAPTAKDGGPERYVTGITAAPDGALYLVEAAAQDEYVSIRKVGMDGKVSILARNFVPADLKHTSRPSVDPAAVPAGQPQPMGSRTYCRGLCVAEDGTIYVAANAVGAALALKPKGDGAPEVRVMLQADHPWQPTDVALHMGDLYVLEFDHTGHDRLFWTPRVRKVDAAGKGAGKIETLATITRE